MNNRFEIQKTNDGLFMVHDNKLNDYLVDEFGEKCFDFYSDANEVILNKLMKEIRQ
jgi:hypothetical protein